MNNTFRNFLIKNKDHIKPKNYTERLNIDTPNDKVIKSTPYINKLKNYFAPVYSKKHTKCDSCDLCHSYNINLHTNKNKLSNYIKINKNIVEGCKHITLIGNPRYKFKSPLLFVEDHKKNLANNSMGLIPVPSNLFGKMNSEAENKYYHELQRSIVNIRRQQYCRTMFKLPEKNKKITKLQKIQRWYKIKYSIIMIQKIYKGYYVRKIISRILCIKFFVEKINFLIVNFYKKRFLALLNKAIKIIKDFHNEGDCYITKEIFFINPYLINEIIKIQNCYRTFKANVKKNELLISENKNKFKNDNNSLSLSCNDEENIIINNDNNNDDDIDFNEVEKNNIINDNHSNNSSLINDLNEKDHIKTSNNLFDNFNVLTDKNIKNRNSRNNLSEYSSSQIKKYSSIKYFNIPNNICYIEKKIILCNTKEVIFLQKIIKNYLKKIHDKEIPKKIDNIGIILNCYISKVIKKNKINNNIGNSMNIFKKKIISLPLVNKTKTKKINENKTIIQIDRNYFDNNFYFSKIVIKAQLDEIIKLQKNIKKFLNDKIIKKPINYYNNKKFEEEKNEEENSDDDNINTTIIFRESTGRYKSLSELKYYNKYKFPTKRCSFNSNKDGDSNKELLNDRDQIYENRDEYEENSNENKIQENKILLNDDVDADRSVKNEQKYNDESISNSTDSFFAGIKISYTNVPKIKNMNNCYKDKKNEDDNLIDNTNENNILTNCGYFYITKNRYCTFICHIKFIQKIFRSYQKKLKDFQCFKKYINDKCYISKLRKNNIKKPKKKKIFIERKEYELEDTENINYYLNKFNKENSKVGNEKEKEELNQSDEVFENFDLEINDDDEESFNHKKNIMSFKYNENNNKGDENGNIFIKTKSGMKDNSILLMK